MKDRVGYIARGFGGFPIAIGRSRSEAEAAKMHIALNQDPDMVLSAQDVAVALIGAPTCEPIEHVAAIGRWLMGTRIHQEMPGPPDSDVGWTKLEEEDGPGTLMALEVLRRWSPFIQKGAKDFLEDHCRMCLQPITPERRQNIPRTKTCSKLCSQADQHRLRRSPKLAT